MTSSITKILIYKSNILKEYLIWVRKVLQCNSGFELHCRHISRKALYEYVNMNQWNSLMFDHCLKFHNAHEKKAALLSGYGKPFIVRAVIQSWAQIFSSYIHAHKWTL